MEGQSSAKIFSFHLNEDKNNKNKNNNNHKNSSKSWVFGRQKQRPLGLEPVSLTFILSQVSMRAQVLNRRIVLVRSCQGKFPLKDGFEPLDEVTRERFPHFRIESDDENRKDEVVEHRVGHLGHVEPQLPLGRQQVGNVGTCHFPDSTGRHHADGAESDDDEDVAVADHEVAAVVKLVVSGGSGDDVIGSGGGRSCRWIRNNPANPVFGDVENLPECSLPSVEPDLDAHQDDGDDDEAQVDRLTV